MNQHAIDALTEALRQAENHLEECEGLLRWQAEEVAKDALLLVDRSPDNKRRGRVINDIAGRADEIKRLAGVHSEHLACRDGLHTALAALRETR